MKRLIACSAMILTLALGAALAAADEMMMMPKAGPESMALAKFFGKNATWTGHCPAGAMGPDSKEVTTHGKVTTHSMYGGLWYACDVEDMMGTGKQAMTWKGHMIVGWDMGAKAYRGFAVDNMGVGTPWEGQMEGNKFSLWTPNDVMMMGQMMKDRLTWVINDDGTVAFTDEHKVGEGDWMVAETGTMKMMGGKAKMAPKSEASAAK